MIVTKTENLKVPIKDWTDNSLEEGAFLQACNLARLPFVFRHVALMPDAHVGYGMPIGGVIACKNVIIPYAVGNDIGCGVLAAKTNILVNNIPVETIKLIMGRIREVIPMGEGRNHVTPQVSTEYMRDAKYTANIADYILSEKIRYAVGTLGGGNHFIELSKDQDGYLWVMLHSGSRNLGMMIARNYNEKAMELNQKWYSSVPKDYQLAFLPMDTQEGQDYFVDMNFALKFAYENRMHMYYNILNVIDELYGFGELHIVEFVHIHHNYAQLENHFGENVYVHRKGAIKAQAGDLAVIPGTMGTASYIVKGLGNPESFMSASHGAGRNMSRTAANNMITEEQANASMGNVIFGRWNGDYSESPLAYKDIDEVMENQKDLVEIKYKLTPVAVLKGEGQKRRRKNKNMEVE